MPTFLTTFHLSTTNIIAIFVALVLIVMIVIIKILLNKVHDDTAIKDEFADIIAHKFRTPLSEVRWTLEELMPTEPDSFRKKRMGDIQKSNQQLIDLTNTLIELADSDSRAKESYNFEDVALCDVVNGPIQSVREQFSEKNISISLDCRDNKELVVNVDKARLEFVIYTLLRNACIYTPTGGIVNVSVLTDNKKALVQVKDNGIGIEKNELPNVFDKFHRADNARLFDTEGLGVALFLSRRIIHRLNGKISAFSEGKDRGSTFSIILKKVK